MWYQNAYPARVKVNFLPRRSEENLDGRFIPSPTRKMKSVIRFDVHVKIQKIANTWDTILFVLNNDFSSAIYHHFIMNVIIFIIVL